MKNIRPLGFAFASFALVVVAAAARAEDTTPTSDAGTFDIPTAETSFPNKRPYSPYAWQDEPRQPYFGDTHLHTSFSLDAGEFGARLAPDDAYRFAKGEMVLSSSGQPARLSRPLDFLVVTDHSDNLGFFADLLAGKREVVATAQGRQWYNMLRGAQGAKASLDIVDAISHGRFPQALMYTPGTRAYRSAWQAEIDAAERFNEPGRFTALLGYEWTSNPGGDDLHRNVIFRDGGERARQVEPFTTSSPAGSEDPVDLWKWMDAYERKTGGNVLAIAHGGNQSNGRMFRVTDASGKKKMDAAYATERARWEPLYEVTQSAGDSETHPKLSPDDEFAAFERWDKGNLDLSAAKSDDMLAGEYARSALKSGLQLRRSLGVNPFQFGFVGGSDSHTGLSAIEEDSFFGRTTASEPSLKRLRATYASSSKTGLKIMDWELGASGYTAVWAKENTRESLWDAMQRRETYSTTGSRMVVRFFGGWDFTNVDPEAHDLGALGYRKGVPMGGELGERPLTGKAPTFVVSAHRDPLGANLDRYQIIKGWMDQGGEVHEKIYDVAVSGARKIDADGRCKVSVGTSIERGGDAIYSNSIGAPVLAAFWTDPDFDPALDAFYYGRVIEIPTPRWTAHDINRLGADAIEGTPRTVAERACTSPIWYAPTATTRPGLRSGND